MAQVNVKYRVHCFESERGWNSEHYHVDFDTREEAQQYWDDLETRFGGRAVAPDYYCIPKRIELIEV